MKISRLEALALKLNPQYIPTSRKDALARIERQRALKRWLDNPYSNKKPSFTVHGSPFDYCQKHGVLLREHWKFDFSNENEVLIGTYEQQETDEYSAHRRCVQLSNVEEYKEFCKDAEGTKNVKFYKFKRKDWFSYSI